MMRIAPLWTLGILAALVLVGCGGGGTVSPPPPPPPPSPPPPPAPVATVGLSQTTGSLVPEATLQLSATTRDAGGNALTGRAVAWATDAGAVATVSTNGLVTALSAGQANITATSEGKTGTAVITVKEGAVVGAGGGTVTTAGGNATITVPAGAVPANVSISVTPLTSPPAGAVAGSTYEFGPSGTTFTQPVTIQLKYDASAAVGADPTRFRLHKHSGTAWTEVPGSSVDVDARTVTGSTTSFSTYGIVALPDPIATVTVAGSSTVTIGSSITATAVARSEAGAVISTTFAWSSSDIGIATVSSSGSISGVSAGTATITATAGGVSGTIDVTVSPMDLNRIVDSVRQARGVPGLVGAIVTRNGGVVAMGVGGNRRIGGPAATLNDKWHLGSNLKGLTGALAAIAVKRGQLTWDRTVEAAFPELGQAIRAEYRQVTLRELLSMQAGIRNDPPGSAYTGATARAQRETAAAWGLGAVPYGPRGSYYYSNISYVIAGAMIERAMGGTYEALLVSELGNVVGATQIGFGPTAPAGSSAQPIGHSWNGTSWVACEACDNPPGLSAAGRAHMSISDWGRIIQELMKADAGGSSLIDQASMRTVFTGAVSTGPGADPYGLGWIVTNRSWGGRTVTHTGSNTINHSMAWVGLDSGIGLIAATNAADITGGRTTAALDGLIGRMLSFHLTGK